MALCVRALLLVLGIVVLAAIPAFADDAECLSLGQTMEAQTNTCKVAQGSAYGYYRIDCLLQYKGETSATATACINAAQAHYEASSGLDGYDADYELIKAATLEGVAAAANAFLGNCNLATSQLKSINTLLTSIINDTRVGDLLAPAKKERSLVLYLLSTIKQRGC